MYVLRCMSHERCADKTARLATTSLAGKMSQRRHGDCSRVRARSASRLPAALARLYLVVCVGNVDGVMLVAALAAAAAAAAVVAVVVVVVVVVMVVVAMTCFCCPTIAQPLPRPFRSRWRFHKSNRR
jgi:hypothetical protein